MHAVNNKKNGSSTTYCTVITMIPTPYTNGEMGNRKQIRTYNGKMGKMYLYRKINQIHYKTVLRRLTFELPLPKDVIYDTYRRIPTTA
jgi:hypothetical protein